MKQLFTFLLFFAFASQVVYAETEPNDLCVSANVVPVVDTSVDFSVEEGPGSFEKNGDNDDYYTITINATGTLKIFMISDEKIDVHIGTSGCGSEAQVINDAVSGDSATINITAGDVVIIYLDRAVNSDFQYGFDLTFKVAAPPVAFDDSAQTLQETAVDIDVTSNDTDDNSVDKTTVAISGAGPSNGTATIDAVTGVVTYTPDVGFTGVDYFDYTVNDNLGNTSNVANVTITVKLPTVAAENCDTGTQNAERDFCMRKQIILPGNMLTIGNTILVAPGTEATNATADCSTYTNGTYIDDATNRNDDYFLCQYHVDGAGTPPATTATVAFPDSNNSDIEWAGLYWQALVDDTVTLTGMQVRIKNGNDAYVDIGYDKINYMNSGFSGTNAYAAFKDVTTVLQTNNWKDGNYTIADIPVKEGKYASLGTFGAWSLVIIYKNNTETIRSFSVFDGWKKVGDGTNDLPIGISGFYTPKAGDIHASVSVFTGEGDKNIDGDTLTVVDSTNTEVTLPVGSTNTFKSLIAGDGTARAPNPTNNQGIDIQTYQLGIDGVNVLSHEQSDVGFHFKSDGDHYWPSMLAFSSEVYTPSFCYDYAYSQNNVYLTEENNDTLRAPRITGSVVSGTDLDVTLYVRNQEDSDILAQNLRLDILDINTSQAVYKRETVSILNPGEVIPLAIPDSSLTVSDSFIKNINYATVAGNDHIYTYYTITPSTTDINISLNGTFNYDLVLPLPSGSTVTIPTTSSFGGTNLPLCSGGNFEYIDQANWSIFNVVDTNIYSTGEKYNIPTQVVRRPGNFSVVAYDQNVSGFTTADGSSTTLVGIDMIDAGAFHDITATCSEATAGISPILWMNFEGAPTIDLKQEIIDAIADDRLSIASAEDFYPNAVKSAAFRISYITTAIGDDDLVKTEPVAGGNVKLLNFTELVQDIGTCKQPVKKFPNSDLTTINVPVACANAGNAGLTPFEMQRCLECLYGYNTHHICSRDNFSIRPESFNVKLSDVNQSAIGTSPIILKFSDDQTGVVVPNIAQIPLSAGYKYSVEINATSHTGNGATPGYSRYFNEMFTSDYSMTMIWDPSNIAVNPFCNDITNASKSFNVINGQGAELELQANVGEYRLNVIDKSWTQVDWNPSYMAHHADSTYYIGGINGSDCTLDTSEVQSTGTPTTLSGGALATINGCNIDTNKHTNADTNVKYRDYNLSFRPYDFNLSTVTFTKGRDNVLVTDNDYVYFNNVLDDYNMSVRYEGNIKAVSAQSAAPLSNFVANCYAEDIDLDINTTLLPALPLFRYRLLERNVTAVLNNSLISDTNGTNLNLTQLPSVTIPASRFTKKYLGEVRMEFNLNLDRNITTPFNPLSLMYDNFGVSCTTPASCQSIAGLRVTHLPDTNLTTDLNVTHIYGRLHTPRQRVADTNPADLPATATIPLYYEYYCNSMTGCDINDYTATPALSPNRLLSQDDVRWYRQALHNVVTDGNATLTQTRNNSNDVRFANGANMNIDSGDMNATYTYDGVLGYPYKVTIELGTQDWLLYNRYDDEATENEFELEFFTTGQWSGKDKSNMGLDANSSTNVNRRVEW